MTTSFVDADSNIDVVLANFGNQMQWLKQVSADTFELDVSSRPPYSVSGGIRDVVAELISKTDAIPMQLDSIEDLAVATANTGSTDDPLETIEILVNTRTAGTPYYGMRIRVTPVIIEYPNPRQLVVVDIDGDSFADLVTSNRGVPGPSDLQDGFSVLINRR